jgi:hypothetical protein
MSREVELSDLVMWIAARKRIPQTEISLTSRLRVDLGVDGDDARELIDEFSRRYCVDIESFPYSNYFGPEAGWNVLAWFWRIAGFGPRTRQFDLTVEDLLIAARTGVLGSSENRQGTSGSGACSEPGAP